MRVKDNRAYYADAPHLMLEEAYIVYRRFLLNKNYSEFKNDKKNSCVEVAVVLSISDYSKLAVNL